MKGRETSVIDANAGGFSKRKSRAKVADNEKAIVKGGITILRIMYGRLRFYVVGPENRTGVPIGRIAGQLGGVEKVIYHELEPAARSPEGGWDWVGNNRIDLNAMGRFLRNREVYNYFKDCCLVKSHKLIGVVEKPCVSLEFTADRMEPDSGVVQGNFPNI